MADLSEYSGLSPIEQLNYFRGRYYNDGQATEFGVVANAINEVLPKLDKMDHLKIIPFSVEYGSFTERSVAVFDDRNIKEEEVIHFIRNAHNTYHPHIIVISAQQAKSVFGKDGSG